MDNINIKPISEWGIPGLEKPVFIAGPCSAESEEQVLDVARQLKNNGLKIMRAGIWKPRTRPGSFEGVGSIGLAWLKKAKEETGLLTSTEIANANHVLEALKYGVDILWIGARTSANPFAVQEIADALQGVDIPVLVKNPVNPDVELWIGAVERLAKAGITRLGAIHRGFSTYEQSTFRNNPQWQIAIEFRRRMKGIPMFGDPSHIGGKRKLIKPLCQKFVDLDFDGILVETHPNPEKAWSDAKQQVTPAELKEIMDSLVKKQVDIDDESYHQKLEELRSVIDNYDDQILDVLQKRMEAVEEIGKYKKENNITVFQPERWDEILGKSVEKGQTRNLSDEFVTRLFKAIHQESINKQTWIVNDEE